MTMTRKTTTTTMCMYA